MSWNRSEFLQEVKEEFEDRLNNEIELFDKWYDTEHECWDRDLISHSEDVDIEDTFDNVVRSVVEKKVMWANDCWEARKDIIGCDEFHLYNDIFGELKNIFQMATAALDQLAREELDYDGIFSDWCDKLDPPDNNHEEEEVALEKAMEKCRSENF